MSRPELEEFVRSLGERRYRAEQLFCGLHRQGVASIEDVSTLPKAFKKQLAASAVVGGLRLKSRLDSAEDGSIKLVLETATGLLTETVIIPADDGRVTQCVSSQVGCKIGCTFCMTATMPLRRNLTAAEIVDQHYHALRVLEPLGQSVTNLVFMGMGEPLDNLESVARACELLMDEKGQGFGQRRITVSTSGIVPKIAEFGDLLPVNLAVSLNATTDEVRDRIMPINRRWPIAALLDGLRAYPLAKRRRITIEYVLLRDVNDSLEDASRLVELLRGLAVKVNLIPFNPWPGAPFERPREEAVDGFCRLLSNADMSVTVRRSRGRDIGAACGMLDGQ
jgi:23S rRNA (adenine2503-C2)-methyltransferase